MTRATENQKRQAFIFLIILALYFGLHIVLRVVISNSLDYDEAEQAMLAQWLLPGYTEQPPLYTWLQHGLFQLIGRNVLAVSVLKNLLLFLTYFFVFLAAQIILKNNRSAILATASILLIPQIGWESQRDMTHTLLVVCASSAALWQGLKLLQRNSWLQYIFLGIIFSVGILAKTNFLLFAAILSITLATFPEGRKVVFSRKSLLTLAVTLLLTSPYLVWMYNHQEILFSTTHKFKQGREQFYLLGPLSLVRSSFLFLAPLLVIFLAIFPTIFQNRRKDIHDFHQRFIGRYIIIVFITVLLTVLLFQVTYVKDRWLQPLLFAFPIFLFSRLAETELTTRRFKMYSTIVGTAALTIYLAFTLRAVAAEKMDKFCRLNYPISSFANDIARSGFTHGLIVSDDRFLAGNFSFAFPDSTAIIPGYNFEKNGATPTKAAIIWLANRTKQPPKELTTFFLEKYNLDLTTSQAQYFEHPYLYATKSTITLGALIFDLPTEKP
ncbi:ArnT family glycosyltransferase [Desulfopila aestuarii]|uniref:Dolichyl-phosphate-mannose-protein mannosyltransferase n=1 Tax=Desulfopila aestuarii DSM 18488 TaxID=1121416 RepID=A0A1M7Y3V5_9BACT|nr:glycosyltransferase family 39 protein [Desulfopila aestuarii]SHO46903.1 Dolichyl-phosphate-mannose-protein mannosyltransferase [Desulfopila aestuarii DSM 18488]